MKELTSNETPRVLRRIATDLRRQADHLNARADELEYQMSDFPLLGGRGLVKVVVDILDTLDPGDPGWRGIHYLRIVDMINQMGYMIRGVDQGATLLANMDRDPRIESTQSRSGMYRLVSNGGP